MARKPQGPRVLTANRLDDGLVVFITGDGKWHMDATLAVIARTDEEASALEQQGQEAMKANLVVGAYLVELQTESGTPVPVEHREKRRMAGPSVSTRFKTARALAA